jgi:hypothetical protein
MTTVSRQSAATGAQRRVTPRVVLSWELPEGTGDLGPGVVVLEVAIEGEEFGATLVCGPRRAELARRVPGVVEWDAERGMWHAGAPGVVIATWRGGDEAVLYARTPIVERLGLVGGTYEFRGMRTE